MALKVLREIKPKILYAHNWQTLPISYKLSVELGTKIILDLHEYSPAEREQSRSWRVLRRPMIDYFLHEYATKVDASLTVSPTIAKMYQENYGFCPLVVLNAPEVQPAIKFHPTQKDEIHLIHHGLATRRRKIELMIESVSKADVRFYLHLMLMEFNNGYIQDLKKYADTIAKGRVFFESPVSPEEIVNKISTYDIGFYLLPLNSFNHAAALPNKFFDFINAGLAICVGPSIEMSRLIKQCDLGVVTPSIEPDDVAVVLNNLSADEIDLMKQNSLAARQELNAENEMKKLLDLHCAVISGH